MKPCITMKKIMFQYNRWGKVVTGGHKYENQLFEILTKTRDYIVERASTGIGFSLREKILAPFLNLKLVKSLIKSDIIFFTSVGASYFIILLTFLRLLNKKTLVIHHHFMHLEFVGIKRVYYKIIEISFLKSSYRVVTPSPYIYNECLKYLPKNKILLWPIPFKVHSVIKATPKQGKLLYIGTIEPRKGLHHLINSLIILKNGNYEFSLTLIGEIVNEEYYNNLTNVIKNNNLDVRFTGFIGANYKEKILLESDFLVFPSLLEGFGMVLCEAMSYGLPVIAFNNTAMPYTIKHNENGLLVDNEDERMFAEAMESLLNNRELRDILSDGAINSSKKFITETQFECIVKKDIADLLTT